MNWSFANGILYLCGVAGIVLMLIGATTSDRIRIRKGFGTLIGAYLALNFISLTQSGTVNSIIISLANRFGVSPKMFAIDVFIGAILAYLFVNFFPFEKLSQRKSH